MLNLNSKEEAQLLRFREDIDFIIQMSRLHSSNWQEGVNLFISDLREYKEDNAYLFKKDFILEQLALSYIDFINFYYVTFLYSNKKSVIFEEEVSELINLFKSTKEKGKLIHYLMLHSIVYNNDDITKTIINLINKDFKYVVKSEDMKLIDNYFVYSLVFNTTEEIDTMNLYKYLFSLDFLKTESSLRYTLILLSIAATQKFIYKRNNRSIEDDTYEDIDIIKNKINLYSFIKDMNNIRLALELDSNGNKYIKVYLLVEEQLYSVGSIYELYSLDSSQVAIPAYVSREDVELREKAKRDYIDNIELDVFSNEVKYLFLRDYINNNNNLSKGFSDNLIYHTNYIKDYLFINNQAIDNFIIKEIKDNFDNKDLVKIILNLFDLDNEILLNMYIYSVTTNHTIKEFLKEHILNNKKELIDDIDIINSIYN